MDKRCKIVLFSLVVLVAVILLGVLIAHKSMSHEYACGSKDSLYYDAGNGNGSCYPKESIDRNKTPCASGMILFRSLTNQSEGICDCDSVSSDRLQVYHNKQCYFIFQQAYCAQGEWLAISEKTRKPTCEANPCLNEPKSKAESEIVSLKNGKCVELGERDASCNGSDVIRFFKRKVFPACAKNVDVSISTVGAPPPSCPSGTFDSPLGGCQPDFEF